MIDTPKKHGGKRPNAGRKHLYEEPTKPVSFAVPLSKIETFKKQGKKYLKKFEKKT